MIVIKAIFGMGFLAVMLWGGAEAYTRHKYGEFSPKHMAVLSLIPGSGFKTDYPRDTKRQAARQ